MKKVLSVYCWKLMVRFLTTGYPNSATMVNAAGTTNNTLVICSRRRPPLRGAGRTGVEGVLFDAVRTSASDMRRLSLRLMRRGAANG